MALAAATALAALSLCFLLAGLFALRREMRGVRKARVRLMKQVKLLQYLAALDEKYDEECHAGCDHDPEHDADAEANQIRGVHAPRHRWRAAQASPRAEDVVLSGVSRASPLCGCAAMRMRKDGMCSCHLRCHALGSQARTYLESDSKLSLIHI